MNNMSFSLKTQESWTEESKLEKRILILQTMTNSSVSFIVFFSSDSPFFFYFMDCEVPKTHIQVFHSWWKGQPCTWHLSEEERNLLSSLAAFEKNTDVYQM